MLIIGHQHIVCEKFLEVQTIQEIQTTKTTQYTQQSDCGRWVKACNDYNFDLAKMLASMQCQFGVLVENITDCMLYASFQPKYILIKDNAKTYQNLADNYLLDSKILLIIAKEESIATAALDGIDGVIFDFYLT